MAKKVALYLRVSTVEQDTTNQRRELEAVAERHGWEIVTIEREMIRERVLSGMARAKSQGKHCGRPKTATDVEKAIKATLAGGIGMIKAAKLHQVGVGTVQRIAREMR